MSETKKTLPVFKSSKMAVGQQVVVVLNSIKETQYGPSYRGTVDGEDSFINLSGNLKRFLPQDLLDGKKLLGVSYTLTRTPDKTFNGRATTQFTLYPVKEAKAAAIAERAETNNVTSVADKLAAIRARSGK